MRRNRMVKGIFLLLLSSLLDSVLTNLGLAKDIESLNKIFPMTIEEGIFTFVLVLVYLYGLFIFITGFIQLVRKKRLEK